MTPPKKNFLTENPERLMIVVFPIITLALFFGAAILGLIVQTLMTL